MAVYSMTGYASVVVSDPGLSLELRSVNSRFLDLSFKVADELRHLEPALRETLTAAFRRGKIEVRLALQRERPASTVPEMQMPDAAQLQHLVRLQRAVQQQLPQARELSVAETLSWLRSAAASGTEADASSMPALQEAALAAMAAFEQAVQGLRDSRAREGDKLVAMLQDRIAQLRALAAQAAPLIPQVVQRQQMRFLERWNEALASTGAASTLPPQALQERALNEAAAFAIRVDVAEELSRLGAHLDELSRLLQSGGELGKRLDFLIQELHREANTLGSKSAALELTNLSVEMKVLIEQMREQVQNLE